MFISGAAMVFSYHKRWDRGESWARTLGHAAWRASILFVIGWALAQINLIEQGGRGEFLLDILPQLALGGFLGFLLLRRPPWLLAGSALGLLAMTEFLYRSWAAPGFDRPFVPGQNFGSYLDLTLFGRLSEANWVTFNIVPSAAFILFGILAGRMIKKGRVPSKALRAMVLSGLTGVAAGLALDPFTPIIRRLCTSSFVLVATGLCFLALALAYLSIDMAKLRIGTVFFVCVGMNPIFIYLFALSGGADWFRRIVDPFSLGLSKWTGGLAAQALAGLAVWGLMWALCRWLYGKKIFFKI
jgi:predicted acyltransferase